MYNKKSKRVPCTSHESRGDYDLKPDEGPNIYSFEGVTQAFSHPKGAASLSIQNVLKKKEGLLVLEQFII